MDYLRVIVLYLPRLYSDLFQMILPKLGKIRVIENPRPDFYSWKYGKKEPVQVDIILLSLDYRGQPALHLLPDPIPDVELIAFSPYGDYGFRRRYGDQTWELLKPFGIPELVRLLRAFQLSDGASQCGKPEDPQSNTPGLVL